MRTYSPNKIKKMLGCQGFELLPNFYMERGSIIHSILENPDDYSRVYSVYRGEVNTYKHNHNFFEYEAIADGIIKQYPALFTSDWSTEIELNYEVKNDSIMGSFILTGIIDKLLISGNHATIIDWKTGHNIANPNVFLDVFQAYFYSLLVMLHYTEVEKTHFVYMYVDANKRIDLTFNRKDINRIYQAIRGLIMGAEYTHNSYKFGSHCGFCKRLTECPLVDHNLNIMWTDKERLNVQQIKALKKTVEAIYQERKAELVETLPTEQVKVYNYYYVEPSKMDLETLLSVLGDSLKVDKKTASELQKKGIQVENRQTKGVK